MSNANGDAPIDGTGQAILAMVMVQMELINTLKRRGIVDDDFFTVLERVAHGFGQQTNEHPPMPHAKGLLEMVLKLGRG
jgi:hypothetical protein